MRSSSCNSSPTSASCGNSLGSSKMQQLQKAVNHCPFGCRCDNNKRSAQQSDMCGYWDWWSGGNQPFPFGGHKISKVEQINKQAYSLHVALGPVAPGSETLSNDQFYQTFVVPGRTVPNSAREDVDVRGQSNIDGLDDDVESSYFTSCTSLASQPDFNDSTDSNEFIVSHAKPSESLSGIGHWVDDHSSSEKAWNAWQSPNILLQHASVLRAASIMMKPHVEEAMNCFRASFYGASRAAEENCYIVGHS